MRVTHVLTLIGAAAISFSAVAAPAATASLNSSDAIAPVAVVGKPIHKLHAADLGDLQGEYALSDGRILKVTVYGGKLYAEVGGARSEIVHAGYNKFVSRDDSLRVVFDSIPYALEVALSLAAK